MGKGSSKDSVERDSYFFYTSAKFTSNYFDAKSRKFLFLSHNGEFYSVIMSKSGVFCLGGFKKQFSIFQDSYSGGKNH